MERVVVLECPCGVERVRPGMTGADRWRSESAVVRNDLVRLRVGVRPLDRVGGLDRDACRRESGRRDLDRLRRRDSRSRGSRQDERESADRDEYEAAHLRNPLVDGVY